MKEKIRVAFFEVQDWEKEYLQKTLKNAAASFFAEPLSLRNVDLVKNFQVVSVFIDSQINKDVLSRLPSLRMIAARSTGFDHIDTEECKKNNVLVCNVPLYGENTVAEHAFALLLDLSRKIYESIERTKKGNFSLEGLQGFDLKDKTLGVVGMGSIGLHVARIAKGFQMNVLGFDVKQDKALAKKLGFKYASFDHVLKNSDIVTLHVPYNKHTHHLLNAKNIHLMKKGAYVINTARGGLIETAALVKALKDNVLAGAALDVIEEEKFIKEEIFLLSRLFSRNHDLNVVSQDHLLMKMDNVIITPHNAFNSKEALERILETTVDNIKGFVKGKVINVVN